MKIEDSMTSEDLYVLLCKYYVDKKWRILETTLSPEERKILHTITGQDRKLFLGVDLYLKRKIGKSEIPVSEQIAYLSGVTSGRKV